MNNQGNQFEQQNGFNQQQNNFNNGGFNQQPNNFNNGGFNQQPNNFNNGGFNQQQNDFNNGGFNQQPNNFNNGGFNQQQNNFNNGGKKPNAVRDFMHGTKQSEDFISPQDIQANKNICILSYLGLLFWIPLVAKKDSRYARFHCNQGLILLLFSIALGIVEGIINGIVSVACVTKHTGFFITYTEVNPVGAFITGLIGWIVSLTMLCLIILGIYNAVNGKAVELPIIGRFRIIKTVPANNNVNGGMNNGGFNPNANMNNGGFNQQPNNFNNGDFTPNNNMNDNNFNANNGFANSSTNNDNNQFQ